MFQHSEDPRHNLLTSPMMEEKKRWTDMCRGNKQRRLETQGLL